MLGLEKTVVLQGMEAFQTESKILLDHPDACNVDMVS